MIVTPKLKYAALIVLFMASLCGTAPAEEAAPVIAPDFTIRQCLRADTIALADYLGDPVLLIFCDVGLVSNLNALAYAKEWHRRYRGDGLKVIVIHSPFLEPTRELYNAIEALSVHEVRTPSGLDMEREVYDLYGITGLPAFILIRPDAHIAARFEGETVYADVERAVQDELRRLEPGVLMPLIMKPRKPWHDPDAEVLQPTPMVDLRYPGKMANADSSLVDVFAEYADARDRTKDVVFLSGRWKVGENCIAYSDSLGGSDTYIRIIYRAKSVYILPHFELGEKPTVYVKQDRSYLDHDSWGRDIMGDLNGKPYIYMQYSIPYQIVDNDEFGTHQLEIIPAGGDVSFYYLYFEGDARK